MTDKASDRQRGWEAAKEYVEQERKQDDPRVERLRIPTQFLTGSKEFQQGWSDYMEGRPTG